METVTTKDGYTIYFDSEDRVFLSGWDWYTMTLEGVGGKRIPVARRNHFNFYMHRAVAGAGGFDMVQHINGNGLDNRKNNLLLNGSHVHGQSGRSNYRGVSWDNSTQKWRVSLVHPGSRTTHHGRYTDEIQAAKAYDVVAQKHFGEFARLNFEGSDALS